MKKFIICNLIAYTLCGSLAYAKDNITNKFINEVNVIRKYIHMKPIHNVYDTEVYNYSLELKEECQAIKNKDYYVTALAAKYTHISCNPQKCNIENSIIASPESRADVIYSIDTMYNYHMGHSPFYDKNVKKVSTYIVRCNDKYIVVAKKVK